MLPLSLEMNGAATSKKSPFANNHSIMVSQVHELYPILSIRRYYMMSDTTVREQPVSNMYSNQTILKIRK